MTKQGPRPAQAPSVRQLHALIDSEEAGLSASRVRQLRMVADMFGRAVGREEMPARAERTVAQLFTWAALRPFWALAVAGELRHWEKDRGKPLPVASQRTVRDCLKILAGLAVPGKTVRLPMLEQAEPKPVIRPGQVAVLYRDLVDLAADGPLEAAGAALSYLNLTRLLAIVAVVLDTAARSGELAAQRVDEDLGPELSWARVVRRPQNYGELPQWEIAEAVGVSRSTVAKVLSGEVSAASAATRRAILAAERELESGPVEEFYPLREGARVAVRRWLEVREGLVAGLTGQKTALWVSIHASKAGPVGLPLRAQGLQMAYARGMSALNMVMAGQHGWEPMPLTLERLRRSVDVEPLQEPPS